MTKNKQINIDALDIKLINLLVENGRLSIRTLASMLHISAATAMKRLRRLEHEKAITGYSAIVDFERIGYDITAVIDLRVSRGKLLEVERKIANNNAVTAVYDTTGDTDAVVMATFRNRRGLDFFLKHIQTFEFVERTSTKLVLNTIKVGRKTIDQRAD